MAKRNLNNLRLNNSKDLTAILSGVLLDIRRGAIDTEMTKNIVSVADKIIVYDLIKKLKEVEETTNTNK